ncbi:MAG: putative CRISPR-associated protein [bacterium]|jgi:putative CRISPR-associated protein (TIGR02619 family)
MGNAVTHLICTVGTSYLNRLRASYDPLPDAPHIAVKESERTDEELKRDSAELNSILCVLPQVGGKIEQIDFFVSDTDDGRYMGELYKELLPRLLDGKRNSCKLKKVLITLIEDLKPIYNRFSPYGLKNLVVKMVERIRAIRERENGIVAINATGGYKAQISFAGLIGQVMGCDVWYQFEDFKTAVRMPPMPVSYSIEDWLDNWEIFDALADHDLLDPKELGIKNPESFVSTAIGALFEYVESEKVIYLNPVGQLFHEKFKEIVKREGAICAPKPRKGRWVDGIHDTPNYDKNVMAWLDKTCDDLNFIERRNSFAWSGPSLPRLKVKPGATVKLIKVDISTEQATYPFEFVTTAATKREQSAAMHLVKEKLIGLMRL